MPARPAVRAMEARHGYFNFHCACTLFRYNAPPLFLYRYESKGRQFNKGRKDHPIGLAPEDVARHRAGREAAERAESGIPGLPGGYSGLGGGGKHRAGREAAERAESGIPGLPGGYSGLGGGGED